MVASGGAAAAALSAAVGGGVLATTLARSIRRRVLGEADPDMLEHDLAMGGLAIFVRVDDGQEFGGHNHDDRARAERVVICPALAAAFPTGHRPSPTP